MRGAVVTSWHGRLGGVGMLGLCGTSGAYPQGDGAGWSGLVVVGQLVLQHGRLGGNGALGRMWDQQGFFRVAAVMCGGLECG